MKFGVGFESADFFIEKPADFLLKIQPIFY